MIELQVIYCPALDTFTTKHNKQLGSQHLAPATLILSHLLSGVVTHSFTISPFGHSGNLP